MYAQIALPIPSRSLFTYALPEGIVCEPGTLVLVPVGRSQRIGVVWKTMAQPEWQGGPIRTILKQLSPTPLLDQDLLFLLDWISRYYLRPLGTVVSAALPSHLSFERHQRAVWLKNEAAIPAELQPLAAWLEKKGALTLPTLARRFGAKGLPQRLKILQKLEVVHLEETFRPRHQTDDESPEVSLPPGPVPLEAEKDLNQEQRLCVDLLTHGLHSGQYTPFLLEGVTGSGKTEVYFHTVKVCLAQQRQALLLVPEIALTPQLVQRYLARFQVELAIFHSGMKDHQRYMAWQRVRSGQAQVVIGARSAIFAPFARLGLVVVDEEHDSSYKQEGGVPYQGRDMAVVRAQRAGAVLVLGSATPSMESRHNARLGRYTHLKLTQRATGAHPPTVEVVNLSRVETRGGQPVLISEPLEQAMRQTLERGHQSLLFLNRRGWAPSLMCRRCGQAIMCPNCSVTLTFHKSQAHLLCHYCDHRQAPVDVCPACGQLSLFYFGPGTEQLEKEARKRFPEARIARLDRDSVSSGLVPLEQTLADFAAGKLDIMVGTQMTAKGHHFPLLALVGVVVAETSLWQPDFRAAERTCQLITQVAGRAGREEIPGRVWIQTFDPDHYAIKAVLKGDLEGFTNMEMGLRQEIGYPPFQRLALLRISATQLAHGENYCRELHPLLPLTSEVLFLGPAPAPLFKLRNRYRWQLLIKEAVGGKLHRGLAQLLNLAEKLASHHIRLDVDVDPYSFQ